jgi:hypothetical protein
VKPSVAALLLVVVAVAPHIAFVTGGCITDDFIHFARLADRPNAGAILASPDAFGFYRPLQQLSHLAEGSLVGFECHVMSRAVSLTLHVGVIVLSYLLGAQLLASRRGGFLAALIWALAPKAPTIAVFWISARADLLVAAFVFIAALAWARWTRGGSWVWVAMAGLAYVLALLSKEAAILLPLVLAVMPGGTRALMMRLSAATSLLIGALSVAWMRVEAGATFAAVQQQYQPNWSPTRWATNITNYLLRASPAPVAALILVSAASRSWRNAAPALPSRDTLRVILFGLGWYIAFIAPTLPISLRSEVRLYLPGYGVALIVAAILNAAVDTSRLRVPLLVCVLGFGGYQMNRSLEAGRDARFSHAFVAALEANVALQQSTNPIAVVPADAIVERRLRDTVGGYGKDVIPRVLRRSDLGADVFWPDRDVPAGWVKVQCAIRDGGVVLTPM